jgi:multisubunit Na+/H+ antiporter MnhF subunit
MDVVMSAWLIATTDLCVFFLFVAAALCLYRIIVGPGAADRAVAFDTLSSVAVGMICLLCIRFGSTLYFDAVWILTLVGFLGSSAIAKYLARGRVF